MEFAQFYKSFNKNDHPSVVKRSCILGTILAIVFGAVIFFIAFAMFTILQLALFNVIMFAIFIVWWIKLARTCVSIIKRCLDSKRRAPFQRYIRRMKEIEWLKALNIEILENPDGKWIEIHLNDINEQSEDNDNLIDTEDDKDK